MEALIMLTYTSPPFFFVSPLKARFFTPWKKDRVVEQFMLSKALKAATGQTTVPLGDGVVSTLCVLSPSPSLTPSLPLSLLRTWHTLVERAATLPRLS